MLGSQTADKIRPQEEWGWDCLLPPVLLCITHFWLSTRWGSLVDQVWVGACTVSPRVRKSKCLAFLVGPRVPPRFTQTPYPRIGSWCWLAKNINDMCLPLIYSDFTKKFHQDSILITFPAFEMTIWCFCFRPITIVNILIDFTELSFQFWNKAHLVVILYSFNIQLDSIC